MNEQTRLFQGDELRVEITSQPDDFNAILDNPEAVDLEFFRTFEDELIETQGAYLVVKSQPTPYLNDDGSITFERVYVVQQLLPPYLNDSGSTLGFVAPIPFILIGVVIAAALAAWSVHSASTTLREPLRIFAQKLNPEVIGDTVEEASGAVQTLAVALVVALIVAKIA